MEIRSSNARGKRQLLINYSSGVVLGSGATCGVPRLARAEDADAEAKEFAHDGGDADFAGFAASRESRGLRGEDGIEIGRAHV